GQNTDKFVAPADHNQAVGHRRQGTVPAQVTQDNVDGDVRAHRYRVGVHQAAGGVFRVGEYLFYPLPVLLVHGVQDFLDHRIRQLLQQVGQVVRFEVFQQVGQFLGIELAQEVGPDVVRHVLEDFTFQLFVDQFPQQNRSEEHTSELQSRENL